MVYYMSLVTPRIEEGIIRMLDVRIDAADNEPVEAIANCMLVM